MNKRIFTYWQTAEGSQIPQYIQLCLQTWYENIPDLELVILNHNNMFSWMDKYFDYKTFCSLTLPQQSDVVSYSVLYRNGGIFMDADTIVVKDIFEELEKLDDDKVHFFGYPKSKGVHMAVIMCRQPRHKVMLSCMNKEKTLLKRLTKNNLNISWDTFGNGIINQAAKDDRYKDYINVLDRTKSGIILESCFLNSDNTANDYLNFYFNKNNISLDEALEKMKFGLACLHNSWTPNFYKSLTMEEVVEDDLLISKLITHALGSALYED